jgi:hypothetical protein
VIPISSLTSIGHSGCPLLRNNKNGGFEAIAIHAGGGGTVDRRWNEAAPLGHKGNDVAAFREALRILEHGIDAGVTPGSLVEDLEENIPGLRKIKVPLQLARRGVGTLVPSHWPPSGEVTSQPTFGLSWEHHTAQPTIRLVHY